MNTTTHMVANRVYTTIQPLAEEMLINPAKNYTFDLSHLSVIAVEGLRALEFLQGQLTCDVRAVAADKFQQGALCNLKGRILALMDIVDNQGVQLILPKDLLTDTLNSLTKAALLSRVVLCEHPTNRVIGVYSAQLSDFLAVPSLKVGQAFAAEGYYIYAVAENYYVAIVTSDVDTPFTFFEKRGSLAWHSAQLNRKIAALYPASRGLFLPHQLELHKTHYLSFDKGCYKGQEIIARMHYRGKLKSNFHLKSVFLQTQPEIGVTHTELDAQVVDFCINHSGAYDILCLAK